MNRFLCGALVLALLACSLRSTAAAEKWNTGTLLSYYNHQDIWIDQGTSKRAGISCYLGIDVGDRIYFVNHHIGYIWEHLPALTENSTIRWRKEKGRFVYLDDAGRRFAAYVSKTRAR